MILESWQALLSLASAFGKIKNRSNFLDRAICPDSHDLRSIWMQTTFPLPTTTAATRTAAEAATKTTTAVAAASSNKNNNNSLF